MRYRVRANEERFFDIAAASIPMYWNRAALVQRLFAKSVAVTIIVTLLTIACVVLLIVPSFWFLIPLALLGLYMIWPIYAFQRYDPYRNQQQADIWAMLPYSVRQDLRFAMQAQWHDMHNKELNNKIDAILAHYKEVYTINDEPEQDDLMERMDHELFVAEQALRIRKGL